MLSTPQISSCTCTPSLRSFPMMNVGRGGDWTSNSEPLTGHLRNCTLHSLNAAQQPFPWPWRQAWASRLPRHSAGAWLSSLELAVRSPEVSKGLKPQACTGMPQEFRELSPPKFTPWPSAQFWEPWASEKRRKGSEKSESLLRRPLRSYLPAAGAKARNGT